MFVFFTETFKDKSSDGGTQLTFEDVSLFPLQGGFFSFSRLPTYREMTSDRNTLNLLK